LLIIVFIGGCSSGAEKVEVDERNLHRIKGLADAYVDLTFKYFPENYVYYSSGKLDHGGLSDNSLAGIEKWDFVLDSLYAEFEEIGKDHEVGTESWYLYGYLKRSFRNCQAIKNMQI
jgi:hypothetical protein